ncbi:hypothetical protein BGZ61DRAFT_531527 [Ilyonectria robusta]|uniref:uncharacterized protein n=1 Tax=Ilyonectria robusta TaxID=1079257 RepID=UPI001E8CD510|nr:uncharacterized protein BGZ61DRAFT_531527 [Ilyonectria robusta]KAH8706322.1 hypothetical protein BGZ61DRAFT_531527 [Ilyonectria robusta]
MLVHAVASAALASLATAQQQHNYAYPPIPCGARSLPDCPADAFCVPDQPGSGSCAFRNTYQPCGGFTMEPSLCGRPADVCVDDPRTPESCGMACDAPGICLAPELSECEGDQDCPEGLWCYVWEKKGCKDDDCSKVCL